MTDEEVKTDPLQWIWDMANQIIEMPEFQRLKHIKQLGCCSYVYKNAKHSRFEHSVDVYELAKKQILYLKDKQPELKISDREIMAVCLASLTHDCMHGSYSHLFDHWLNSRGIHDPMAEHEARAGIFIDYICVKYNLPINKEEQTMMKLMINPTKIPKERRFLYQILANKDTNLDVDKLSYLTLDSTCFKASAKDLIKPDEIIYNTRVIDNHLCLEESAYIHSLNVFTTRFILHRDYYNSAETKAVDSLMMKLFDEIDVHDKILSSSIHKIEKFLEITDSYILKLGSQFKCPSLEKLRNKAWNKCIARFKLSTADMTPELQEYINMMNKEDNLELIAVKIGLVSGNRKNPLKQIQFYKHSSETEAVIPTYNMNNFVLFSDSYQEILLYVYVEDMTKIKPSLLNDIAMQLEVFKQEKTTIV